MKIILTEKEAQQVEMAAVQKLVQDRLQNMIEARAEEMNRELNEAPLDWATDAKWSNEPTYTLADIHKKYLSRPMIDVASGQKSLLIPAGVDVSKVKMETR